MVPRHLATTIIVDDIPVQVKCSTSILLLQDHFATYPDIPVIADNDLIAQVQALGADGDDHQWPGP